MDANEWAEVTGSTEALLSTRVHVWVRPRSDTPRYPRTMSLAPSLLKVNLHL